MVPCRSHVHFDRVHTIAALASQAPELVVAALSLLARKPESFLNESQTDLPGDSAELLLFRRGRDDEEILGRFDIDRFRLHGGKPS